ncbi:MAG: TonB C-terminal domain-containing protein, partial [Candidatus Omnitrophica bacterium]|nr:TonB C-terminal domain-containing protein [Candidatus Omnitrophota bacterium]
GHGLMIVLLIQNNYGMKKNTSEKVYVVDLLSLPARIEISNSAISPFKPENAEASSGIAEDSLPAGKSFSKTHKIGKTQDESFSSVESFSPDQYMLRIKEKLGLFASSESIDNIPSSERDMPFSRPERQRTGSLASKIFPLSTNENSIGMAIVVQSYGLPSGNIIPADYLENIKLTLQRKWKLPEEKNYSLTCAISFRLKKDGTITSVALEASSGVKSFDEGALKAVRETRKFEPLPATYKLDYLDVAVKFNLRGIE